MMLSDSRSESETQLPDGFTHSQKITKGNRLAKHNKNNSENNTGYQRGWGRRDNERKEI